MLSESQKKKIVDALTNSMTSLECPMCHNHSFSIINGYIAHPLQNEINTFAIGGGSVMPTVAIVCKKCGFMSQHSLGILGLLEEANTGLND